MESKINEEPNKEEKLNLSNIEDDEEELNKEKLDKVDEENNNPKETKENIVTKETESNINRIETQLTEPKNEIHPILNQESEKKEGEGEKDENFENFPKIKKYPQNLTEVSNEDEGIHSPNIILIKKPSEINVNFPIIRNKYYNELKSLDNPFYRKKLKLEQEKHPGKKISISTGKLNEEEFKQIYQLRKGTSKNKEEMGNYLELYNCDGIEEDMMDLKGSKNQKIYKCKDFMKTKFNDLKSFNVFYSKLKRDNEIIRKGGKSMKTPSFNLIRATKNFRVVPNPIGVVKRKGEASKLELNNKLTGNNYIKCLCESLLVSEHLREINLKKNRLSDISIIPLFKTIIKNQNLLKRIFKLDLSFNKIGMAGTELICQYILEYDCILEHLNLECNNLGNNNAKKIINAMTENLDSKIRYLNIGQNLLDDDISVNLTNFIKKCEFLTVLILYQNQFSNQGAGLMMSEIKKHYGLKILDMSWNLIGTNLTDEVPTLDELIKGTKNPNNHFDNAYLNELKYTLEFRRPGSISPARVGSKISYFTSQLCELFHNKHTELLHLDISYNNLNVTDAKAISENIKDNHTILGIHVDGNDMWVDELGFVYPVEKSKYQQNHFAKSQIFYRISENHPLIRSNALNVQKLRAKNNCWICEGWREVKFHYKPNKYEGDLQKAYMRLHLNFENYKSCFLKLSGDSFVGHRMCPPGNLIFFLTMNGVPVDNYGNRTHELKDAIIYTEEKKPKEFEDEDEEEEGELKQYIITKVAQTNVEINPEVITPDGYLNMIKFCVPRPEKSNLKKRPRTPWSYPTSLWAYYGYDYEGEPDSVYNNAFEFDYERCNFGKDKDLTSDEEVELRNFLRGRYKAIVGTYKNLSAYLGWKIWQIGQNQISEFVSGCPDLLDKNYLINDVLVKVTEVKSNAIDKQERKKNQNIPDNIIRHQFMMLLVRIAKDKYFRTKQKSSIFESVEYSFENHYDFYLNQFDNHKWRKERYYNEGVDNILKAYIPIFDALFYSYAPQQIMGRKDSFWMTLEGFTNMCNVLMDSEFPVKELPVIFNLSMKLQTNEITFDKHYNMTFPEFLEAICRFIDKLSPIPHGEDPTKWDMKKRQEQTLRAKIENIIPQLMKLISGQYKSVRDKFIMPKREEDVDLFKIDYENPLYEGKLPKKVRRRKSVLNEL